jgi:hypothetical protein
LAARRALPDAQSRPGLQQLPRPATFHPPPATAGRRATPTPPCCWTPYTRTASGCGCRCAARWTFCTTCGRRARSQRRAGRWALGGRAAACTAGLGVWRRRQWGGFLGVAWRWLARTQCRVKILGCAWGGALQLGCMRCSWGRGWVGAAPLLRLFMPVWHAVGRLACAAAGLTSWPAGALTCAQASHAKPPLTQPHPLPPSGRQHREQHRVDAGRDHRRVAQAGQGRPGHLAAGRVSRSGGRRGGGAARPIRLLAAPALLQPLRSRPAGAGARRGVGQALEGADRTAAEQGGCGCGWMVLPTSACRMMCVCVCESVCVGVGVGDGMRWAGNCAGCRPGS